MRPAHHARLSGAVAAPALVLLALAGCGDDDDAGGPRGSAGGGAGGGVGAGGQAASGGAGAGGAGGAGGGSCVQQQALVNEALAGAQACEVGGGGSPCDDVVEGLCCDEVIADAASGPGRAYRDALAAFKGAGCSAACPRIVCRALMGGACAANAGGLGAACRPE